MPFDDVPEDGHIHISAQQAGAVPHRDALRFRKTALGEIRAEMFVERRADGLGQISPGRQGFGVTMAERLAETERMHQNFQGATAHAGRHFAAQQPRG